MSDVFYFDGRKFFIQDDSIFFENEKHEMEYVLDKDEMELDWCFQYQSYEDLFRGE